MNTIGGTTHAVQPITDPDHCPVCLTKGIPVPDAVLKSMLKREWRGHARNGYRFCSGRECSIAYFDGESLIGVAELNKAITLKDPGPEALVCYCLRVSRGAILEGIRDGSIGSSADAKAVTKACTGKACHIVNPGGICCGDQLRDTVVAGLTAQGADPLLIEGARSEDPGSTCCGRTLEKVLRGDADDGCCATTCGI